MPAASRCPRASPGDPPDRWTLHGLATRKNELFLALLETEGVRAFPGTTDLVRRLREAHTPLGLVTASRNASALLAAAGLTGTFDVVVDGEVVAALGLPGKPDPAMFLQAAQRLGVAPARAAVVEDAVSGVAAARRGGFGLVVGIDRDGQRHDLEAAGADFVLDDVAQLDLGVSRSDPWLLVFEGFDPAHEAHREALTTLGNGYLGTRGALPEHVDDGVHYPGTYLAGVYNRLTSTVEGEERVDEELVNAPNWLPLDLALDDGGWWSDGALLEHGDRRELDLRRGVLTRTVRLTDPAGRTLQVVQRRLVSMDRPHLAALETRLTPVGWSGRMLVRSSVDADVVNGNAVESRLLANRHLGAPAVEHLGDTVLVEVQTTQSEVRIATAARTRVSGGAGETHAASRRDGAGTAYDVDVVDGQEVVIEKVVAIVTSRDDAVAGPRDGALAELARADDGFEELLRRHVLAWDRLWEHFAVDVDTDEPVQLVGEPPCVPHAADGVAAHRGAGRRRPRPRPARRGVPRPRLLGPAVHPAALPAAHARAWPARCSTTAGGGCPRPGRRPARPGTAGRCSPGRAGATAATRRRAGCSTPGPDGGCRTTRTCSGTSGLALALRRLAVRPGHR